jgi:hypothetical protein
MSDDLISRKALIADMRSRKYVDKALCEIFETIVDDASVAFDKEKVINEIQISAAGKVVNMNVSSSYAEGYVDAAKDIIEIVKRGGIE